MKTKKKLHFSTTHIILFSFLFAILLGTVLLMLPISSANGTVTPFIDALFTATTATCVTGLVVVPTFSAWSVFGQVVILALIQIGGLGIVTVIAGIAIFAKRRFGLSDSILIQDAFNLNSLSGLIEFVKKVIIGTLIIEGIGALAYMTVFVPKFGVKGIWISVFTAISAFCNAGIDVIGSNSLCDYATNPIINVVTCFLIILGGLGFIVWWDILNVIKESKQKKGSPWRRLTLHSKIALASSFVLIVGGAIAIFAFEYSNPNTIGNMSFLDKIQVSIFQSVTTRTAGFASISQKDLTLPSAIISLLLMFIGGSPVGTAGGIKTVTFAILIASALSAIKGKNETSMFKRRIPKHAVNKAIGVLFMSFVIVFASAVALGALTDASAIDVFFEAVSATATVGLTRDLTPTLNTVGKIIIICSMYLGRVGPISLAIAFNVKKENKNIINDPTEEISVG